MNSPSTVIQFGGRPVMSARQALAEFARMGWDASPFRGRANSYRCPLGSKPGEGFLLMLGTDVEFLLREFVNQTYRLTIGTTDKSIEMSTFVIRKALRLTPGVSQDADALFLVEIADGRYLDRQAISGRLMYNVRWSDGNDSDPTDPDAFLTSSLDSGALWNWDDLLADLNPVSTPFYTPLWTIPAIDSVMSDAVPENLRFQYVPQLDAIEHVLNLAGCTLRYDPINGNHQAVAIGTGLLDVTGGVFLENGYGGRTLNSISESDRPLVPDATPFGGWWTVMNDCEAVIGNFVGVETVVVRFPARFSTSRVSRTCQYFAVEVDGEALTEEELAAVALKARDGSAVVIDDPMHAFISSADSLTPTASNQTALEERAEEVARNYYRGIVGHASGRVVISGVITHDGDGNAAVPGPMVREMVWRDYGDGLKTEILRTNPGLPGVCDCNDGSGGGSDIIEGFLTTDLAGSTGDGTNETTATMDVWSGDGAAWASTGSTETVTNRDDSLSGTSGAYIQARRAGTEWRPVWLSCSTQNEIQRLTITGTPTGGTITVSFEGEEIIIPFDATAPEIYALLTLASSIGPANVDTTGGDLPGTAVDIEFINDLSNTDVPMLLLVSNDLTGGTAPDATITLVQSGCCG